jgi:hypothetical protein
MVAALVAAALLAGAPCSQPGEWPHTRDAAWLYQALRQTGYRRIGCTGSAFVIGRPRHDLYVWAFSAPRLSREPGMRASRVAGVRVYWNRIRAVWRAGRRNVWVEAGPTTDRLPRPARLRRLVRATVYAKRARASCSAAASVVMPSASARA